MTTLNETQIDRLAGLVENAARNIRRDKATMLQNYQTIGHNLYLIKSSFNGSTKEFGSYLERHCPSLEVKLTSYMIKLAGYNQPENCVFSADQVRRYLVKHYPNISNPRLAWDKFWANNRPNAERIKKERAEEAAARKAQKALGGDKVVSKGKLPASGFIGALKALVDHLPSTEMGMNDLVTARELAEMISSVTDAEITRLTREKEIMEEGKLAA